MSEAPDMRYTCTVCGRRHFITEWPKHEYENRVESGESVPDKGVM